MQDNCVDMQHKYENMKLTQENKIEKIGKKYQYRKHVTYNKEEAIELCNLIIGTYNLILLSCNLIMF